MATIKIGGRDLAVRRPTVGFWERCVQHGATIEARTVGEVMESACGLIFEAVQDNEGVTLGWLKDNLSFPPTAEFHEVLLATGLVAPTKDEAPAGEAQTQ